MNAEDKKKLYELEPELAATEERIALESTGRVGEGFLLMGDEIRGDELSVRKARAKEADDKYRRLVGDTGFDKFKADYAIHQSNRDESFMRMLLAKKKHADEISAEVQDENEYMALVDEHVTSSAAAIMEQSVASKTVALDTRSQIDALDGVEEMAKEQLKLDEKMSDEERAVATEAASSTATVAKGIAASGGNAQQLKILQLRSAEVAKQIEPLKNSVMKCYAREYNRSLERTKNEVIAHAKALSKAREFSKSYFTERLARGNNLEVIEMLNRLQEQSDENFKKSKSEVVKDANGKPILDANGNEQFQSGYFNPFDMVCCRHSDFKKIAETANSNLRAAKERDDRERAEAQKRLAQRAERVKGCATLFALGINPDTSKPFTGDDERNRYEEKMLGEIDSIKADGYEKPEALLAFVRNQSRIELQRREKLAAKVAKAKLEKDVYDEIIRLENSPNGKYVEEVEVEDANGQMKKTTVELDAARGICTLIDEARLNGLCKGTFFTDLYKRKNSAEPNRQIVERALNKVLKFPLKETQSRYERGNYSWGDRKDAGQEYIMLSLGDNGTLNVANVSGGQRVFGRIGENGFFGRREKDDLYFDSTTLKEVANIGRRFLEREMEDATEEGLTKVLTDALDKAVQKGNQASFGRDFVLALQNEMYARYTPMPATVGQYNPYVVTPAIAAKPDYDKVRTMLPLVRTLRSQEAKNAIMLANQPDEKESSEYDAQFGITED